MGHSESLQPATRLGSALTDNYGNSYVAGTSVPERSDFDSLDNPFFYTADPTGDGYSSTPAASLNLNARTQANFNQFLHTTHRQNFLVPPRAHRSFPLAEFR